MSKKISIDQTVEFVYAQCKAGKSLAEIKAALEAAATFMGVSTGAKAEYIERDLSIIGSWFKPYSDAKDYEGAETKLKLWGVKLGTRGLTWALRTGKIMATKAEEFEKLENAILSA